MERNYVSINMKINKELKISKITTMNIPQVNIGCRLRNPQGEEKPL
jgi:hypothetical protein